MMFFIIAAFMFGNKDMSAFSAIVCGSTIGFLFFNMYPARVFMGDTGSLALGGAFCSVALMLKMPFILVVVAGVCVIEAISVILQVTYFKISKGKRLFKMAPIHHHLELSGMKETTIVPMFWGITALLAVLSICMI
jgi:phospho-N-acetylmuramoyl-pentapeptide-transferase